MRGGGEKEGDGRDVLGQVVGYLEEARKWSNVSSFVRQRPFEIDAGWRWEWQKMKKKTKKKKKKKKARGRDKCEANNEDGGVML